MASPVRYPGGVSTDFPWQPLANFGLPNPFDYHFWEDDFDDFKANANTYTVTATGNGAAANYAIDGGAVRLTTNSSTPATTDIVSVQLPAASYAFVPSTSSVSGKTSHFWARVQLSDVTNAAFVIGLGNTTTAPFSASLTDGLYFTKASGSTQINLVSNIGGTTVTTAVPVSAYTLANATYIDLCWYYDGRSTAAAPNGTVQIFVGNELIAGGQSNSARGPVASFQPTSLTTALMNPTLAVQSGTASSKTMTVDFLFAARQR